jgi:hypothetical protein
MIAPNNAAGQAPDAGVEEGGASSGDAGGGGARRSREEPGPLERRRRRRQTFNHLRRRGTELSRGRLWR